MNIIILALFISMLSINSFAANSSGGAGVNTVDSNGNIGIGTAFPGSHLSLSSSQTTQLAIMNTTAQSSTQGAAFNCDMNDGTQTVAGSRVCTFQPRARDNAGALQSIGSIDFFANGSITSSNANGYIRFRTAPSGSATLVERMRIMDSGNIGIGTINPTNLLQLGNTTTGLIINSTGGITSAGNVGISTTAPTTCGCKQYTNGLCTTIGTCS